MQQMNGGLCHCFGGARARLRLLGRQRDRSGQVHACMRRGAASAWHGLPSVPARRWRSDDGVARRISWWKARRPTNSFHACMHRSSRGRCRLKVSAGASHAPQQIMLCAYSLACVASSMQACSYLAPRSISTTIIINSLPCCMDTYMYLYETVVLYI